ncbi:alpha/beta hydrolase [Arthrobacter sp. MI7-26]|uniref:alpha/beta fold hydrolase n=1 Tax=Arthrobacter sp. MI7-26 TaxID=2993653 RepID=UPI0022495C92|nr:alpha/beta hydrolase [Arthrobacter sp. MI7-26]MCX2749995.1 alpha/beta hydrolase [Arthrobacter sp. MI7-26]
MSGSKGYVNAAHGQLHYRREGDGGKAVVLLHQAPSSSWMWEMVTPRLAARGYDVVAFDLPGHGTSDSLPTEPSLQDYAGAIAQGTAELGLNEYAVVGHHTGCAVAMVLSVLHPDRVKAVVGWGIPRLAEPIRAVLAHEPPPEYDYNGTEILNSWRAFWKEATAESRPNACVRSMAEMLQTGDKRAFAHRAVGRANFDELIAAMTVPMLALAGSQEMLRKETEAAARLSPLITFSEFGDAGTYVADEQPDAFASAIDDFLRGAEFTPSKGIRW